MNAPLPPNRVCRILLVEFCLGLAMLPTSAATAVENPVLAGRRLALQLDGATGAPTEIRIDGQPVTLPVASPVPFDIRQEADWLIGPRKVASRLIGFERRSEREGTARVAVGDWELRLHYSVDAQLPAFQRSFTIVWNGTAPTKLKGFWCDTPRLATGPESAYFAPGSFPPQHRAAGDFQAGTQRTFSHSPAPLIVQLTPGRSLVWLTDELAPTADRGSVAVREEERGLRVTQSFNIQARMKPGDAQNVGVLHFWAVEGDGEAALRSIPAWMRAHGHRPPADRPDWFRDAVIYSFHPGGTIGSQFRDLGGFTASLPLLDRIAALGATAIWVMPIEDAAVYHPRDYYKFQPGLGTADEYKALVARAHALGLHVLQDCVPHGGRNDYPRAKEHPEWLAYEEDGSTLDYWCYDFNWPTWRQYMADVARHYVRQFDVDGYRVDAVGGSRIPNWNPDIPYARASHAQLQGGLNMLRSLRGAVKELKPAEGGLLAEVQGSVYGAVSDAIYDFGLCYNVLHDLRRSPPELAVPRLRRWLHEQQYAETPDLLRLRHVESHDSLRAQLWYGVEPHRALLALTAWIHGIPLVYHEMEEGHSDVDRRIFAIRKAVAELRRGDADYLAVETPPQVFACLRTLDNQAAVVLINLGPKAIEAQARVPRAALPAALRETVSVGDLWQGRPVTAKSDAAAGLTLPVALPPFGFTVYALRAKGPLPEIAVPTPAAKAKSAPASAAAPPEGALELAGQSWRAWIGRQSGLLERFDADKRTVLGPADLHGGPMLAAGADRPQFDEQPGRVVARRKFGPATLVATYSATPDALHVKLDWQPPQQAAPTGPASPLALYLPVVDARRWSVQTAEGLLTDEYRVRHLPTDGVIGSIYWRPQGTNVLWDSLLQPLSPNPGEAVLGAEAAGGCVTVQLDNGLPARVAWLERLGERRELGLRAAWQDPAAPLGSSAAALNLTIRPEAFRPPQPAAGPLRPAAGGWEFENDHYVLRLSRSGTIVGLSGKGASPVAAISASDLYTDRGFGDKKLRYRAWDDVEAGSRIWRVGNDWHLRFEGRLRASNRFDLLRRRVDFFYEYVVGSGASFQMTCGIHPHEPPAEDHAFLGLLLTLPSLERFTYRHAGQTVHSGTTAGAKGRTWQARAQQGPWPDDVELLGGGGTLLRLTELKADGTAPLANLFVDGQNFFLTWFDGPVGASPPVGPRWLSAVVTVGRAAPAAISAAAAVPSFAGHAELLRDPGFEAQDAFRLVSLRTGQPLGATEVPAAWTPPPSGRLVREPVAAGRTAAEVRNTTGGYELWRQTLPSGRFAPGTRWRLSARVKGDAIVAGNAPWKVGVLRFAVDTGRTQYVSSPALSGTFDWKTTQVEWTVPENVRSLRVEVGLNGAQGTLWIDEVRLEKVD